MAKYYHQHCPRYDAWDGNLIPYESYEQYFSTLFSSQANRQRFYEGKFKKEVHDIIFDEWQINKRTKDLTYLPSDTYFMLSDLCRIHDIRHAFDSTQTFCDEMRLDHIYNKQLPRDFWDKKDEDKMLILIVTREQKPFYFKNSEVQKLSVGDYMAAEEHFSKVGVDRKCPSDFKGSFGMQIDRIRSNIQLAKDMGFNLHFVVESTPEQMEKEARKKKWDRTNFGFIYRNVREVLVDFPETQILFCSSKRQAEDVTRKILYYGDDLKGIDLQYFINIKNMEHHYA